MILRTEERPHYTMYRVNGPAIIAHCTQRIFLNTLPKSCLLLGIYCGEVPLVANHSKKPDTNGYAIP